MRCATISLIAITLLFVPIQAFAQNIEYVGSLDSLYAYRVFVTGDYAYVHQSIINIGNPASPNYTAELDRPYIDIFISGNYAYGIYWMYHEMIGPVGYLDIYNIVDSSNPVQTGSWSNWDFCYFGIFVSGNYIYLPDTKFVGCALLTINISDPTNPIFTGIEEATGTAYNVFVYDNYAYMAAGSSGLHIIDVGDPSNPALTGSYDTPGNAQGIFVAGVYAYVADGDSGLQIINVGDPFHPSFVGSFPAIGNVREFYVSGNYAYLPEHNWGLQVVDVTNPADPVLAGSYDTPGSAKDVFILDDYIYVADSSSLQILRFNPQDSLFAPAVNYDVGGGPSSIFAADFNGDGHYDLATTNKDSATISILINIGDGTFQPSREYPMGISPISLVGHDFDGDGDKDLAVACDSFETNNVSILLNNGTGIFQNAVDYYISGPPRSIFGADLDGDSDYDLAVVGAVGGGLTILRNNGDGTFQLGGNYDAGGASVFAADLDGDGDKDLITSLLGWEGEGGVLVLINNGDASFQTPIYYPAGANSTSVFAVDLDNDGDRDLVVANYGYFEIFASLSILINIGDGTFQAAVDYPTQGNASSVFAADFDGDNDKDIVVGGFWSNIISVYKNYGDGVFETPTSYPAGANPVSMYAIDLDGDEDYDLASANMLSNDVSILINLTIETGVNNPEYPPRPLAFSLSQNYPNPFNAQTTIQYSIPIKADVSIDIFDILGRKIETLAEGVMPAGEHQATWDASGRSSGIYFYRIKAGDRVETKKMLMMK